MKRPTECILAHRDLMSAAIWQLREQTVFIESLCFSLDNENICDYLDFQKTITKIPEKNMQQIKEYIEKKERQEKQIKQVRMI